MSAGVRRRDRIATIVWFDCNSGYTRVPYDCIKTDEYVENRVIKLGGGSAPNSKPGPQSCGLGANNGGSRAPTTSHPIDIMTGSKLLEVRDFATADGSLSLDRFYNSISYGNQHDILRRAPWGVGQGWRFTFQHELHLYEYIEYAELATPQGSALRFRRSSGVFSPYQGGYASPQQTDYKLEFVGTYPGSWSAVLASSSQWKITDSDDNVWLMQTYQEAPSGKYFTALPVSVTFRGGLVWTFTYGTYHELTSITDSYGKSITFTWYMNDQTALGSTATPTPVGIASATLPDGTVFKYIADSVNGTAIPINDRLTTVEHRDASNNLLDSTTYLYENADFVYHVTGVKDSSNTGAGPSSTTIAAARSPARDRATPTRHRCLMARLPVTPCRGRSRTRSASRRPITSGG